MSVALGHPPKVVLLRFGNCSVADLRIGVERREASIRAFAEDTSKGLLVLDRPA